MRAADSSQPGAPLILRKTWNDASSAPDHWLAWLPRMPIQHHLPVVSSTIRNARACNALRFDDGISTQGHCTIAALLVANDPITEAGAARARSCRGDRQDSRWRLSHDDRVVGPGEHAALCCLRRPPRGHRSE